MSARLELVGGEVAQLVEQGEDGLERLSVTGHGGIIARGVPSTAAHRGHALIEAACRASSRRRAGR
jgi:hypothetical protein